MTPQDVLQQAVALLHQYGRGTPAQLDYRMGADFDGQPPAADCSAFAARCCNQRKVDARKLWWNTDRIYADAQGGHVRWQRIDAPEPGCIGVYPGRTVNGKRLAGHVWIVRDVATCLTVECSSTGKGIASLHRPTWFTAGAKGNRKPILWAKFVG